VDEQSTQIVVSKTVESLASIHQDHSVLSRKTCHNMTLYAPMSLPCRRGVDHCDRFSRSDRADPETQTFDRCMYVQLYSCLLL